MHQIHLGVASDLLSFLFNGISKDDRLLLDEVIAKMKLSSEFKVKLQPLCNSSNLKVRELKIIFTVLLTHNLRTLFGNSRELI